MANSSENPSFTSLTPIPSPFYMTQRMGPLELNGMGNDVVLWAKNGNIMVTDGQGIINESETGSVLIKTNASNTANSIVELNASTVQMNGPVSMVYDQTGVIGLKKIIDTDAAGAFDNVPLQGLYISSVVNDYGKTVKVLCIREPNDF
jgi:hypothetical protein